MTESTVPTPNPTLPPAPEPSTLNHVPEISLGRLDSLLEAYLDLLDEYTALRTNLSKELSDGFYSLARANHTSPGHSLTAKSVAGKPDQPTCYDILPQHSLRHPQVHFVSAVQDSTPQNRNTPTAIDGQETQLAGPRSQPGLRPSNLADKQQR